MIGKFAKRNPSDSDSKIFTYLKKFFFFFNLAMLRGTWYLRPDQGLKPHPLHWKHGVLTTTMPGKSHIFIFRLEILKSVIPAFCLFSFFCFIKENSYCNFSSYAQIPFPQGDHSFPKRTHSLLRWLMLLVALARSEVALC